MYSDSSFPFSTGGISHITYFLPRFFAKKGHHVELVFKINSNISLEEVQKNRIKNLEITPITDISLDSWKYPIRASALRTIKLFLKQIKPIISKNYDIVHFKTTGLSELFFLYPLLAKLRGKKTVLSCYDYNLIGSKNFIRGGPFYNATEVERNKLFKILIYLSILIFKFSWKFYDLKTIYSSTLHKIIKKEKLSDKNVKIIPIGIDLSLFKDIPKTNLKGAPSILFVGLYSKIKGTDIALKAFKKVEQQIPMAKMYFIGSESDVDVSNLIKRLEIKNFKNFGKLSHKETLSYIKGADLCIFPYRSKSFGVTLFEALAAGKPVIAPNTGDFKELIKDNVSGVLVSLDPEEIGNRIISLWENEELRALIASNSKDVITKYEWSAVADEYIRCYYQLLDATNEKYSITKDDLG